MPGLLGGLGNSVDCRAPGRSAYSGNSNQQGARGDQAGDAKRHALAGSHGVIDGGVRRQDAEQVILGHRGGDRSENCQAHGAA